MFFNLSEDNGAVERALFVRLRCVLLQFFNKDVSEQKFRNSSLIFENPPETFRICIFASLQIRSNSKDWLAGFQDNMCS